MEYYIVRIYRRDRCKAAGVHVDAIHLTGLVEDDSGHKEPFHDAETLWKLLAREKPAVKRLRKKQGLNNL